MGDGLIAANIAFHVVAFIAQHAPEKSVSADCAVNSENSASTVISSMLVVPDTDEFGPGQKSVTAELHV
jgi:hypothetical protein